MKVRMHMIVEKEEKERWIVEATKCGETLTKWVTRILNQGSQIGESNQKPSISDLKNMIKGIEEKPKTTRSSIARETYQKDEWVDPI